jgi:hypothetical protein
MLLKEEMCRVTARPSKIVDNTVASAYLLFFHELEQNVIEELSRLAKKFQPKGNI